MSGRRAEFTPHRPPRPEKSEGGVAFEHRVGATSRRATSPPPSPSWCQASTRSERDQVLLGVTGSGKTFTMAQGDRAHAAPGPRARAQQDAGRPALRRVQELLPRQRGRVLRLLLRLLPARSLRAAHRHLHREGIVDQRADRPHAPRGDARAAGARRRDHRRVRVVHLRHRLGRDLHGHDLHRAGAARRSTQRQLLADLVALHYRRNDSNFIRGTFRVRGDTVELFPAHLEDRAWRISLFGDEVEIHHRVRSADRPEDRRAGAGQGLRQLALRDAEADAAAGGARHQGRAEAAPGRAQRAPAACWRRSGSSSARCSTWR